MVMFATLLVGALTLANTETSPRLDGAALETCYGKYAMCDAAACTPLARKKSGVAGSESVKPTQAICECFVEFGHNLGPGPCKNRIPRDLDGKVPKNPKGPEGRLIMSTYSFALFGSDPFMTCPANKNRTVCFGYPCVVDEKVPNKAYCTCPIIYDSPEFKTQGGRCDTARCSGLWQGGTPAEYEVINRKFANDIGIHRVPSNTCTAE